MQKRFHPFASVPLVAALLLMPVSRAVAQRPPRPPVEAPRVQPAPKTRRPPAPRNMLGLPPRWVERLQGMSPAEQERFLSNNARFRSLPPERQAQIRQRLQIWNGLTPEQHQAVLEREQLWHRV